MLEAHSRSQANRLFFQLPLGSKAAIEKCCTCSTDNYGQHTTVDEFWNQFLDCPLHGVTRVMRE
jgi:hypothetical protein